MSAMLLALAAVNPLAFPSYGQEVVAEFATDAEAQVATCAVTPLPDDAEIAFSCRWDDTNPADVAKAEMMVRAGVKGSFYFTGEERPFFFEGPKTLTALGHALGNHTLGHPHMMTIVPNLAFRQIAESRIRLEKVLQRTVMSYVSPFGWESSPFDPDHPRTLAECVVASGHFVSQDAEMKWSRLSPRTWMWTNRFAADDTNPNRAQFVRGVTAALARAKGNPDAPRVTFGTHAWCGAEGNARQEAWLKEFFHPAGAVQLNDWEYGAYRYQYLHGGVAKVGAKGPQAIFRVTRYAAAYVGDAIALSLRLPDGVKRVTVRGKPLERGGRGTWSLPQDAAAATLPRVEVTHGGALTVTPDERAGTLTLAFVNETGAELAGVYLAAALPPKWSERRVSAAVGTMKPGAAFRKTFPMGGIARAEYAFGTAYYPASVDFVRDGAAHRLWTEATTAEVAMPASVPARAAKVWGPAEAARLADVDWAAVSVPGAELPDAANWKSRKFRSSDIWSAVTAPLNMRSNANAALRRLLTEGDHARYVVYDFECAAAGTRRLRLSADVTRRKPFVCLNGVRMPFTGDGQRLEVRQGANRLLLRADAVPGAYYTDVLHLAVED